MSRTITPDRLADLLLDPQEDLDLEVKNWLDLKASPRDKATFAKAAIALANHGGGRIVLGFRETGGRMEEAPNRPATLDTYSPDLLNGIVHKYCDPPFHCSVQLVADRNGAHFPIVTIPGGHRVPIRARRAGPDGKVLEADAIYIRKPGPKSEPPRNGQEWESLLSRCQWNRRDELLGNIRHLLMGTTQLEEPANHDKRLDAWIAMCFDRWTSLIKDLPAGAGPRFPHGYYNFAYEIVGDVRQIALPMLPNVLRSSEVHYTGWPPFWYPTREGIAPYPMAGVVECWLGSDTQGNVTERDPSDSDFWRISPEGLAFLLRGYQEDGLGVRRSRPPTEAPGNVLGVTLPVWRAGETLLQAERLAANLCEGQPTIRFAAKYTGLRGRSLVSLDGSRALWDHPTSQQEEVVLRTHVESRMIGPNLPEIVHTLLRPLYALFDFFDLPMQLVVEELKRLRRGVG
ncbi:MAG: hypothetical protein F4Z12_03750 [Acidobacteria bacterium]|nr:hypothetical protein [Acidobacteriota bacterium]MYE94182.1 hypothetical protein [Gemmatimonadota bacterium]MYI96622.1 hypothetical protein [Acidobacteriota bacterium]